MMLSSRRGWVKLAVRRLPLPHFNADFYNACIGID